MGLMMAQRSIHDEAAGPARGLREKRYTASLRKRSIATVTLVVGSLMCAALGTGLASTASAANPLCQPKIPGGQVFITPTCDDPVLNQPYTDITQQGSTTDPATNVTVNYTYVHGGFTGTNARFSFYFPAQDRYLGRFFEYTYPLVSVEDALPGTIAFGISHGAYVVSTNNDGGVPVDQVLGGYRVNAAAAKYSQVIAAQLYGTSTPARGYIYGGSGGA